MNDSVYLLFNVKEINTELIPALRSVWYQTMGDDELFQLEYALGHWYCYWLEHNHLALLSDQTFKYPVNARLAVRLKHPTLEYGVDDWIERTLYRTVSLPPSVYANAVYCVEVNTTCLRLTLPIDTPKELRHVCDITRYLRG